MMGHEEGLSRIAKALLYLSCNADKDKPEAKRRLRGIGIDITGFSKFHSREVLLTSSLVVPGPLKI